MLIDLHAKNQVNIYKRLEKKSGKLCDHWNLLRPKPVIFKHAKNQVNICKYLGKKSEKLILRTDRQTDGLTGGLTAGQSGNLRSPSALPEGD